MRQIGHVRWQETYLQFCNFLLGIRTRAFINMRNFVPIYAVAYASFCVNICKQICVLYAGKTENMFSNYWLFLYALSIEGDCSGNFLIIITGSASKKMQIAIIFIGILVLFYRSRLLCTCI